MAGAVAMRRCGLPYRDEFASHIRHELPEDGRWLVVSAAAQGQDRREMSAVDSRALLASDDPPIVPQLVSLPSATP